MKPPPNEITSLLSHWTQGEQGAADQLLKSIYKDLRQLAGHCLGAGHTDPELGVTVLVNETYLLLQKQKRREWKNRGHFYSVVARLMRRVLVDAARRQTAVKRGGKVLDLSLEEATHLPAQLSRPFLDLDLALTELEAIDPEGSRLIELRFFVGLSVDEIAGMEGVSASTVARRWRLARARLYRSLTVSPAPA